MALAEIEPVPFLYVVDDVVLMVTFWSAGVVIVKLDFDTVSTVPVDPPAAGPDRALDPPPESPGLPDAAKGDVAVDGLVLAVALTMP